MLFFSICFRPPQKAHISSNRFPLTPTGRETKYSHRTPNGSGHGCPRRHGIKVAPLRWALLQGHRGGGQEGALRAWREQNLLGEASNSILNPGILPDLFRKLPKKPILLDLFRKLPKKPRGNGRRLKRRMVGTEWGINP